MTDHYELKRISNASIPGALQKAERYRIINDPSSAHLRRGAIGSGELAYHWFRDAMDWYEKAEGRRPAGNDEPILRWNTCARILARNEHIRPRDEEPVSPGSE